MISTALYTYNNTLCVLLVTFIHIHIYIYIYTHIEEKGDSLAYCVTPITSTSAMLFQSHGMYRNTVVERVRPLTTLQDLMER